MAQKIWYTAKGVGKRYDTSPKWVYHMQKIDPRFPKGVRFSGGMTRWSEEQLEHYDEQVALEQNRK